MKNRMKELWDIADLKGIPHYKVYEMLHRYNWEAYLHDYNPNAEWGNKQRRKINEEAIEAALIEIDFIT